MKKINELVLEPCTLQERYVYAKSCMDPYNEELNLELERHLLSGTLVYDNIQIKLPVESGVNYTDQLKFIKQQIASNQGTLGIIMFTNHNVNYSIFDSPYFNIIFEIIKNTHRHVMIHDYLYINFSYTTQHMECLKRFLNITKGENISFSRILPNH